MLNPTREYDIAPDGQRFLALKNPGTTTEGEPTARTIVIENWFEELKERVPVP